MQLPLMPRGMHARAWPPVLATQGPSGPCVWHSHHALRFALALEGEVRIRTARTGKWASAAGVLTAPDVEHLLDGQGARLLLVFLDPESALGAPFRAALSGPARLISDEQRRALVQDVEPRTLLRSGAAAWAERAARVLGVSTPSAAPRVIHPRVRALLSLLRSEGIDEQTSLELLAGAVGLSPSRLMHVFTSSVGIPLRPYLAWLRVQRAAMDIVNGSRIVEQLQERDTQLSLFMHYGNLFAGKVLELKHLGTVSLTDVGTTYKVCRNSALQELIKQLDPAINLEFNAYFLDSALTAGMRIVECPITFHPRVGASKGGNVNNRIATRLGIRMLLGIFIDWKGFGEHDR